MFNIAKLNTANMFDDKDHTDKDYPLWEKIAHAMDGEMAFVIRNSVDGDKFVFLGLVDEEKNKELHYMMEQDSRTGCFVDNREVFEEIWKIGEYECDSIFCIEKEFLVFDWRDTDGKNTD